MNQPDVYKIMICNGQSEMALAPGGMAAYLVQYCKWPIVMIGRWASQIIIGITNTAIEEASSESLSPTARSAEGDGTHS